MQQVLPFSERVHSPDVSVSILNTVYGKNERMKWPGGGFSLAAEMLCFG